MIPPKQLSERQLGILMAGWITWHTPDTKSVRPFTVDDYGILTTLSNDEPVYPADNDFQKLITYGYIEPIGEKTYILTNEADDVFAELPTLYLNRSADAVGGRSKDTKQTMMVLPLNRHKQPTQGHKE